MPILSSSSSSSKTRKYSEQSLANFNRAQFFFNPSHIQPQTDRRCLQRLHIENSFAKLNSFVIFSCGEDKLPAFFKEFYDELLHFEIDPAHSYQLIINSLTYFYSKITWATSVQKCVFEFICEFLGEFHSHLDKKRLIELELVCLLELFMLRYEYKNGNENNIFNILVQIRKTSKGADCHLSGFVNNVIINHFGYTLEPLLRNICDRLNLQVKLYRSSDSLQNISTKRKSSMTSSNQESHTSSIEPTFSEDEELIEEEGNSEDEISKSIEKKRSKSHDKIYKLANKKLKATDKLKIRKKTSRGRRHY
uniref:Uncharacterized protein n=1 Tax=Meloidogyne enterolobii TaxID=390850 RepID=A0A6V7ULN0_MELEN|nr:unnamed protein product [Meloidogyne enterolobii]